MNYNNISLYAYRAGVRASLYSWVGKVWEKLKGLKAWMGFYGDLLVFAGVYLFVRYVVPFGKVVTDVLTMVFVLMAVFSVFYIAWAKVRQ